MVESEISISLSDDNLKNVVEVLGSKSAVRILEILAEEDLSVGEISDKLGMKLNTVDYNVRKLLDAGLIEKVSHLWSVKGRKILVYRACNRRIVISPIKKTKNFLLGWLGIGVVALGMKGLNFGREIVSDDVLMKSVSDVAPRTEMLAVNVGMTESVLSAGGNVSFWMSFAGWEWFLFGVWVSVLVFFVYGMLKGGRK